MHVVQLVVAGGQPYPDLPAWLRTCFISLTALDPLAALLLLRRLRTGVVLAVVVLLTDALADGLANHAFDETAGVTAGRIGQAVITLLALGSLVAAPALWRATSRSTPSTGRAITSASIREARPTGASPQQRAGEHGPDPGGRRSWR